MIAPDRGFSEAEFSTRTARLQAKMAAVEMAGLLLTTEPEVRNFSGFYTPFWQSPTRPRTYMDSSCKRGLWAGDKIKSHFWSSMHFTPLRCSSVE